MGLEGRLAMRPETGQLSSAPPNAFRGASSFRDCEIDHKLFCGRDDEANGLASQILTSPLVVLFGRSGVGKTSLINAALMPVLRKERCCPVSVQLAFREGEPGDEISAAPLRYDIAQSIICQVKAAAAANREMQFQFPHDAADLWSFFSFMRCQKDGTALRPVLIIDQFEQLFHRFERDSKNAFIAQLADLVANRVPETRRSEAERKLANKAFISKEEEDESVKLAYGEVGHNARILLSIRDDAFPALDELKDRIPTVFRTTFWLLPLHPRQGRDAIRLPPQRIAQFGGDAFSFKEDAAEDILSFLQRSIEPSSLFPSWKKKAAPVADAYGDGPPEGIDPLLLQILCHGLDEERKRRRAKEITGKQVGGPDHLRSILKVYYDQIIRSLPPVRLGWNARRWLPSWSNFLVVNFPRSATYFLCERGLVTRLGQRNTLELSHAEETYGVPRSDLRVLVKSYLLQTEPRRHLTLFELSRERLAAILGPMGFRRAVAKNACLGAIAIPLLAWPVNKTWEWFNDYRFAQKSVDLKNNVEMSAKDKAETIIWLLDRTRPPSPSGLSPDFAGMPMENLDLAKADGYGPDFRTTRMHNVVFNHAKLPKAHFMNATLGGVNGDTISFQKADLGGSRFDSAIINSADFTNADLARAVFVGATLRDVNFTNADLRNASFHGAQIGPNVNFKGSAWWLVKGLTQKNMRELSDRYPHAVTDFENSLARQKELGERRETITKTAKDARRHIEALKDLAWVLATSGSGLDEATTHASKAMEHADSLGDAEAKAKYKQEINDTLSLIYLMSGALDKAEEAINNMNSAGDKNGSQEQPILAKSQKDGEWHYRHALLLAALGKSDSAKSEKAEAERLGYEPTYELVLLKGRVAALEQLN
jgi:uncharacterized protein YjbI with pentapeptide repeats